MSIFLEIENLFRSPKPGPLQEDADKLALSWGKQLPEFVEIGDSIYHFGKDELVVIEREKVVVVPRDSGKEVQVYPK